MPVLFPARAGTLAVLATALLTGAPALAQACPDWQLSGTLFSTDATEAWTPQRHAVTAGGPLNLAQCGSVPGYGYMTQAPSFTITYDAQDRGLDLDFRVEAQCDTLMLINDSGAAWHFNDDEDGTLNPRLRLAAAPSGVYDVWVGTFGTGSCPATLVVESFPAAAPAPSADVTAPEPPAAASLACPDWSLGGAQMNMAAGEEAQRDVVAGGNLNLFQQAGACGLQAHGYVAEAPDFTLYYNAGNGTAELRIAATGDCDTLLLVNDLNANWLFNDDHVGLDPMIAIPAAGTGRYDIWVGTYGEALCRASLTVTSVGAAPELSK